MLVTGGAGFIGSHLVDALIAGGHEVRVLDDLFTGREENVHPDAELIVGSIGDADAVSRAVNNVELVFHEAAHKAVLRSVEQPLVTDSVNVNGTLRILEAATNAGVRRVIAASSSSVYGGAEQLPTVESVVPMPRSPYAVSKLAAEHYCRVFAELHGLETVSLRYFNVFGPRQRPDSEYAAVIPLFIDAMRRGERPIVFGDGLQSRDFTYVSDVVRANILAATKPMSAGSGRVYNIAVGRAYSLIDLLAALGRVLGVDPDPVFTDPRTGDIRHSWADTAAAAVDLGFACEVTFEEGLRRTVAWCEGQSRVV